MEINNYNTDLSINLCINTDNLKKSQKNEISTLFHLFNELERSNYDDNNGNIKLTLQNSFEKEGVMKFVHMKIPNKKSLTSRSDD